MDILYLFFFQPTYNLFNLILMSKNKTLSESVKNILTFAMVIVITSP